MIWFLNESCRTDLAGCVHHGRERRRLQDVSRFHIYLFKVGMESRIVYCNIVPVFTIAGFMSPCEVLCIDAGAGTGTPRVHWTDKFITRQSLTLPGSLAGADFFDPFISLGAENKSRINAHLSCRTQFGSHIPDPRNQYMVTRCQYQVMGFKKPVVRSPALRAPANGLTVEKEHIALICADMNADSFLLLDIKLQPVGCHMRLISDVGQTDP